MSYLRKTFKHGKDGNIIEVCKYKNGRYGRQIKNNKPIKETPPEQLRWQSKNNVRKCWRLLDDNFCPGDLWIMLSYPYKVRSLTKTVRQNMSLFLRKARKMYKKAGKVFKYIFSAGRGKRGAVHFHMVLPKFNISDIRDLWAEIINNGDWVKTEFEPLDKKHDYYKLANYIIKNSEETFNSDDPVYHKRYCASKNLIKQNVRAKVIKAKDWKKQPAERPGYYIDKERSYIGYNVYGYPVQYTVYVKLPTFGVGERGG